MSQPARGSLRRRLVIALLGILLVAGLLASLGLYWLAVRQQGELFDERLRALSFNLPVEAVLQMPRAHDDDAQDGIVVQVWRQDGVLLWTSEARPAPMSTLLGMVDIEVGGERWRSFARAVSDGLILQVSQELGVRERRAAETALQLLLPLLILLPLLAVLTGWAVSRELAPLRRLADRMRERTAQDTSPVQLARAPQEIEPVLASLNELLARQAQASQRQREFLADVAHELRTPLAAVRLQAQRAESAGDGAERRDALIALRGGIDRAAHLVSQLLSLARSESVADAALERPLALDALVREVVAQRHPLAQARGLDLGVTEAAPCTLRGDAEGLHSLLGNLVDNALAYTPAPGQVDVSLKLAGDAVELAVEDSGPGIEPARRVQLFDRFVRGGNGDAAGTGLGLAIARRVAERHGGHIALTHRADRGGLRAVVRLPLQRARTAS